MSETNPAVGNNLDCAQHIQSNGVVVFVEPGRNLNNRTRPGAEVELIYGDLHVGLGRVLSVVVTQIGDVPEEILAYNQDYHGRTQADIRVVLNVPHNQDAEVTVAIVDVIGLTAHDENDLSPYAHAVHSEAVLAEEVTEDDELDEMEIEDPEHEEEGDEDEDDAEDLLEQFDEIPEEN